MKGIKEWAMDVDSNEELAKKFEGIENPKEIVDLAKKEGYEFTEEELMDLKMEVVSGGFSWNSIKSGLKIGAHGLGTVLGYVTQKNTWDKIGEAGRYAADKMKKF